MEMDPESLVYGREAPDIEMYELLYLQLVHYQNMISTKFIVMSLR